MREVIHVQVEISPLNRDGGLIMVPFLQIKTFNGVKRVVSDYYVPSSIVHLTHLNSV